MAATTASATAAPSSTAAAAASRRRPTARFSAFTHRFSMPPTDNLMDAMLYFCTLFVEKAVLILGPLLILLALSIISGLAYTFFAMVLPMLISAHRRDHLRPPTAPVDETMPLSLWSKLVLTAHVSWVIFCLGNIMFNYYMCVTTKHSGDTYDKVVRELAQYSDISYPSTPAERDRFAREVLERIRRRTREQESQERRNNAPNGTGGESSAESTPGLMLRTNSARAAASGQAATPPTTRSAPPQQQTKVRNWMLLRPDEWGYCTNSRQAKPPRAHYDHVSKTLVLNLDHYCPWMFNAIGYFNYRYFCNFLWFVETGMLYGACLAYQPFANIGTILYRAQVKRCRQTGEWKHFYPMVPLPGEKMAITLSFTLCLAVGIAVFCLGSFHLYLVLTGQTTIEFHGNYVQKRRAKKLKLGPWKNPYDLGYRRNWQQVYGTSHKFVLASLLPSCREPDCLPLPVAGAAGLRRTYQQEHDDDDKDTEIDTELGVDSETIALVAAKAPTPIQDGGHIV